MPALTTALQNSLLDLVLRKTTYTPPTTLYLGLFTTAVTAGATGTEVTGGSYARPSVAFAAASNGVAINTADIVILGMPATTVTYLALMSAATAGTHLFYGQLSPAKTANAGDTFTIRAGDLNIALQ